MDMGYKNECKRGLVIGEEVSIATGLLEYTGTVLSHDNKNNNDYSVVLEIEEEGELDKNDEDKAVPMITKRVIIPLSGSAPVITYIPSREMLENEEKLRKIDANQKPGETP